MTGNRNFWPIFCGWPQLIIFWPEKFFFSDSAEISDLRPHRKSKFPSNLAIFWCKWKNKNGKNMAGNRNFWPIFSGRPQIIIFWPGKIFFMIRTKFQASGHFESQNFCPFWAKIAYFGPKSPIFTKNFKFLKILRPEHGRSIFSYISEDICI